MLKNVWTTNLINENGNPAANQIVIHFEHEDGTTGTIFQSYDSIIAVHTYTSLGQNLLLFPDWEYSKTTMKHFRTFLNGTSEFEYHSKPKFLKAIEIDNFIHEADKQIHIYDDNALENAVNEAIRKQF